MTLEDQFSAMFPKNLNRSPLPTSSTSATPKSAFTKVTSNSKFMIKKKTRSELNCSESSEDSDSLAVKVNSTISLRKEKRKNRVIKRDVKSPVVVAASDISSGCVSAPVLMEDFLKRQSSDEYPERMTHIEVLEKNNELVGNPSCWPKFLPLSEDCHSQNVQLQTIPGEPTKWVVRALRSIQKGEVVNLWFSEGVTAELGLPFLSPVNIQGGGRYMCHRCPAIFTSPNPLKLHLVLGCQTPSSSPVVLWKKLGEAIDRSNHSNSSSPSFAMFLANAFGDNKSGDPNISHSASQCWSFGHPSRLSPDTTYPLDFSRNSRSAFTPLLRRPCDFLVNPASPSFSFSSPLDLPMVPNLFVPPPARGQSISALRPCAPTGSNNHTHTHAEMEALVSSLGRSKQGHLCLYCGKLYSRKYGLKIHLRTHTGYKPLKCRVCLRPFGDPSNLNKHVRLHAEGETPYRCEHCGKVLVRRRDLERHIRSRHPAHTLTSEILNSPTHEEEQNKEETRRNTPP